jgi:hypothetical protein
MPKGRLLGKKPRTSRTPRRASQPKHKPSKKPSARTEAARARGLSAINLVRKGRAKNLTAAARTEGTTVKTIRRLLPGALIVNRRTGRVRGVKAEDRYSQRVKILTDEGLVFVTARGSRERNLAGHHLSVWSRVLGNEQPPSSLAAFKGKTVGGHELVSEYNKLRSVSEDRELEQLDALYVVPEVRS